MKIFRVGFVGVALAMALAACASSPIVRGVSRSVDGRSVAELEALYKARQDSALINVSPADVKFMSGMIGHHAQALVMSAFAPDNNANRTIQVLAARITNAQTGEIELMQRWLRDRKQDVPEVMPTGHLAPGSNHDVLMPGMLTQDKIAELGQADGAEFDRLFLTYMIQHHQGAVTMVHELFATDGAAQDDLVFKLASDIQVDQITEVARMKLMLEATSSGRKR